MITPRLNKMLRYIVILFALTPCCWSAVSQARKCDDKIISKIKEKFWNHGFCIPRDLIRTSVLWKTINILRTADDHYDDAENINCAYLTFTNTSVKLFVKYEKSSSKQDFVESYEVTENDGVLVDKVHGEKRYYLSSGNFGVRELYRCSDTGKTGAPDGLIEVAEHGYDKEALEQSVKNLESLGIKMSTKISSDNCAA